jgi:hypothetical protein
MREPNTPPISKELRAFLETGVDSGVIDPQAAWLAAVWGSLPATTKEAILRAARQSSRARQ